MSRVPAVVFSLSLLAMGPATAEPRLTTAQLLPAAITSSMPGTAPSVPEGGSAREQFTIVIGGDLGFGGSDLPVTPDGAPRHGQRMPFTEMTRHLAPLLAGDLVFANLETVVTERNDLAPIEKAFNFRSHPAGLRHLVGLGLNAVSLANNHAFDYGEAGLRDTLRHVEALRGAGLQAAPGVGLGRSGALAPGLVNVRGVRVHIGAVGIGAGGLPESAIGRAGMASWNSPADMRDGLVRLAESEGDLKILSVHYGQEMQVRPSASDERRLREAAATHGIDLVVGHHAHVVAGVQDDGGRLIFFGLGNLLHPGMQDMGRHGLCRDYGLLARVHYSRLPGEAFRARAVEVVALDDMHTAARPRTGDDGRTRVAVLNHLAAGLDQPGGARGVRFEPQPDGSGLHCTHDAANDGGRIGALCRGWTGVTPTPPETTRRIAANCGAEVVARRGTEPVVRMMQTPTLARRDQSDAHARELQASMWGR